MSTATAFAAPTAQWHAVVRALLELSEGKAELQRHTEKPWASATFQGTRHTVVLAFEGIEAAVHGEAMIEALPEHEFAVRGQLVADCSIDWVERAVGPLKLTFAVTLLLLEDR